MKDYEKKKYEEENSLGNDPLLYGCIRAEDEELPFDPEDATENEEVPFGEDGAAEDGERDIPDDEDSMMAEEENEDPACVEQELMESMDTIVFYMKQLQVGLFRIGKEYLRFCPPGELDFQDAILDDYDFIDEIRWESPGYERYVKCFCEGHDPLEDPSFKIELKDAKMGYSDVSGIKEYETAWMEGQYSGAISRIEYIWLKQSVPETDREEFNRLILRARYGYEYMVYDRNALLALRGSLIKDRARLHRMVLALVGEVRYLYRSIRNTGGEVPLTGHCVDFSRFASHDDPHRYDYTYEGEEENDYLEDIMQGRYVGEEYFDDLFTDYDDDLS